MNLYFLVSFRPLFISSQTGRDYYSAEQNAVLRTEAQRIGKETGVPVLHETHRGRFPFCVNAALQYANAFPDIRFTAGFSHFCTVSESCLEGQNAGLQIVSQRSAHVHARVGHPQGPQITDPRLPEWREALNHHLKWWDAIIGYHRSMGARSFTITPEFGPAPYKFSLPRTKASVADQWEIDLHMMHLLKNRYTQII